MLSQVSGFCQLPYSINRPQPSSQLLGMYKSPDAASLITVTPQALYQWDISTGRCTRYWQLKGKANRVKISTDRKWVVVSEQMEKGDLVEVFSTTDFQLQASIDIYSLLANTEKGKIYNDYRAVAFDYNPLTGWLAACNYNTLFFYHSRTKEFLTPEISSATAFTALTHTRNSWLLAGEFYARQQNVIWELNPDKQGKARLLDLPSRGMIQAMIPEPETGAILLVQGNQDITRLNAEHNRLEPILNQQGLFWLNYTQYYWDQSTLYISNDQGCFSYSPGNEKVQRVKLRYTKKKSSDGIDMAEKYFFLPWDLGKGIFLDKDRASTISVFVMDSIVWEADEDTWYQKKTIMSIGNPNMVSFSSIIPTTAGEFLLQDINNSALYNSNRVQLRSAAKEFPPGLIPVNHPLQYLPQSKRCARLSYTNENEKQNYFLLLYDRNGWLDSTIALPDVKAGTWTPHLYVAPDSDTLYMIDVAGRLAYTIPPGSGKITRINLPAGLAQYWPVYDSRMIKMPNGHLLFCADLILDINWPQQSCRIIDSSFLSQCRVLAIDTVSDMVYYQNTHPSVHQQKTFSYQYQKDEIKTMPDDLNNDGTVSLKPANWNGSSAWIQGLSNGTVKIRSQDLTTVLHHFKPVANAGLYDLEVNPAAGTLTLLMRDYTMRVLDLASLRPLATLFSGKQDRDYYLSAIDSNNHFLIPASQNSLVNWVYRDKAYDFLFMDKYTNRPADVLRLMRSSDTAYIRLVQKATDTRLKRSQREMNAEKINELPVCQFETDTEWVTDKDSILLHIRIKAGRSPVLRWQVFADNIPLLFSKRSFFSRPIDPGKDTSFVFSIELPHSTATRISIRVFDSENNASLSIEKSIYRYRQQSPRSVKTWYLGLGCSQYRDSSFNLRYAAKDVKDIASRVKTTMNSSSRGGALTITDSMLNMKNIITGFAWLIEKAAINDVVIISFSGHGVTSSNGKFYFMLYDSDFSNPEETALSFDQVFEVLKILPCRKKLVLLDACESGDFDNDGYLIRQQSAVTETINTTDGSRGGETRNKESARNSSAYLEWMKDYFNDTEGESAATIIGASSGTSVALENDDWKNGIFSYAFIHGLFDMEADLDKNNSITISELRDYITETVTRATNGRQRPSVRNIDLRNNWQVTEKLWLK